MKFFLKILFTLALSAMLVFPVACLKNGGAQHSGGAQSGSEQTSSSGSEQTSSSGNGQAEPEDLWDVSSVDVSHINPRARLIAFTFDDGPTSKTAELLNVFEDFNAKNPDFTAHATLFTVGSFINDGNSAVLSRAVSIGFELGNHTYTHTDLTTLTDEKIIDELKKTDNALKAFDGKAVHLVRPAGGHADNRVLSCYRSTFINWTSNLDTGDWNDATTENDVYNSISKNLTDGGIVLMHQGYAKSINAVKRLLPELKLRGFQVVSVSELIRYYKAEAVIGKLYNDFI